MLTLDVKLNMHQKQHYIVYHDTSLNCKYSVMNLVVVFKWITYFYIRLCVRFNVLLL